eukprot:124139-Lingulodinium_polyedra.AAC.1
MSTRLDSLTLRVGVVAPVGTGDAAGAEPARAGAGRGSSKKVFGSCARARAQTRRKSRTRARTLR